MSMGKLNKSARVKRAKSRRESNTYNSSIKLIQESVVDINNKVSSITYNVDSLISYVSKSDIKFPTVRFEALLADRSGRNGRDQSYLPPLQVEIDSLKRDFTNSLSKFITVEFKESPMDGMSDRVIMYLDVRKIIDSRLI